jgi:hypothetical protein
VPSTTIQKRTQSYTVMVPETVTTMVSVARKVQVCEVDPCTGCSRLVCKTVCEQQPCTRTVMKAVCQTREVDVPVTTYAMVSKQGMRTVTECVPSTQEVMVNVTRYNQVQKQGMQTVTECVPTTEEYTVNVTRYNTVTKEGTRMRLETQTITETVPTTETYVEQVPYTYTVRVAVGGTADPCSGTVYSTAHGRKGLLGGGLFGCCK